MTITREAFETYCTPRIAQYAALWLIRDSDQRYLDYSDLGMVGVKPAGYKHLSLKVHVAPEFFFLLSAGV
jgi:hypothetical protein